MVNQEPNEIYVLCVFSTLILVQKQIKIKNLLFSVWVIKNGMFYFKLKIKDDTTKVKSAWICL